MLQKYNFVFFCLINCFGICVKNDKLIKKFFESLEKEIQELKEALELNKSSVNMMMKTLKEKGMLHKVTT